MSDAERYRDRDGRILVDLSLFPQGDRELGTGVVISPIVVNDNVVDLLISPGAKPGDQATIRVSPDLGVFKMANEVVTGPPQTASMLRRQMARDSSTGSVTVRVSGTCRGRGASVMDIVIDDPAELAIRGPTAALRDRGISVRDAGPMVPGARPDFLASPRAAPTRRVSPNTSRCRCRKRSR
jgi:D-alanyl-D-alanine carboxypeptidase/D-alanyl-D-alanine-endopeptidase (penicillin-binding protein 4)